ncbi:MAG TPA: outer membrane lipoprotein-sorting protein, partial [Candidatus Manganitrophaceae bacterium]|nr:outer membrane lipoprotein-sorting protein [Candidatus Manganitrophaceae bacterium]
MIQKRNLFIFIVLSILWGSVASLSAQEGSAPQKGLGGMEIIQKSRELIYQIQDQKNTVTLTLIEKDGSKKKIVADRYWKNYRGQEGFDSKTLLITEFPPDSRGISFLIWDYAQQNKLDDLWLYLPALRMVRRISVRDQNDAFLGSDLTFGDMGQRRIDEDEHRLIKEERYQGVPTYVIESAPKEKESLYSKKISWISKENATVLKIDYYDRNDKLLKRQIIEWQTLDKFSVWKKTEVTNVQNGHRTLFEVSDLKVNAGLRDDDFNERALK